MKDGNQIFYISYILGEKKKGKFSKSEFSKFWKDEQHGKAENYAGQEGNCRAPLLKECPQHHGHKGDPGVTPGTCGAIGERAQVILVWVRAPGRWERLPPTETRSHEG